MTGDDLRTLLAGHALAVGWCRRDRYELVLAGIGGCVRFDSRIGGVHVERLAAAPDPGRWAPIGEASTLDWYRADLGLTTLAVAIAQGLTVEAPRLDARSGDTEVRLTFVGARTFVLYSDADVEASGRLVPRLRSRWEELA